MFPWNTGARQTNGATANFARRVVDDPTGTPVPVAAVRGNVLLNDFSLMHNLPQQARPISATTGGFAPATHIASPMVRVHDSLEENTTFSSMPSHTHQVRPVSRSQAAFSSAPLRCALLL